MDGGLEVKTPVAGNFRNFLKKITILRSFGSHFERFKVIGKNKVAEIKNLLEILKIDQPFQPSLIPD